MPTAVTGLSCSVIRTNQFLFSLIRKNYLSMFTISRYVYTCLKFKNVAPGVSTMEDGNEEHIWEGSRCENK